MKFSTYDGCFIFTVSRPDLKLGETLSDSDKEEIIEKIIVKMRTYLSLDEIIKQLSFQLEPTESEHNYCEQCGNYNNYEEYEV